MYIEALSYNTKKPPSDIQREDIYTITNRVYTDIQPGSSALSLSQGYFASEKDFIQLYTIIAPAVGKSKTK